MVLIDDKKYACETCIKGHRSSSCKHTDRPLFEIKKKGRPVTQCEHCRELRKTKQVHVKCLCESKEENVEPLSASASSRKGGNKVPKSAVFPNGLPEDLEASVALQLLSEGLSDSDCGEQVLANTCSCKEGGTCECCTPRKSAPRRRKTGDRPSDERDSRGLPSGLKRNNIKPVHLSPPSSQVLARIAELRPVLPRPPNRSVDLAGSSHDASSSVAHGHSMRHYTRDNLFSPYGRAYDMSHGQDHVYGRDDASEQGSAHSLSQSGTKFSRPAVADDHAFSGMPMRVESRVSNGESFPSTCNCGDGCTCPGCVEHNNDRGVVPSTSAFSLCVNPGACSHCLDCTILSLPASLPPNTALSIYDPLQSQSIDEWIRQISTSSTSSSGRPASSHLPDLTTAQNHSSSWENYRAPPVSAPSRYSPSSECCGGRCKCPSGMCTCTGGCCGCCQGCKCADHEHHDDPLANTNGLTFSTSRERQACCLGAGKQAGRSFEDHRSGSGVNLSQVPPSSVRMSVAYNGYLDIPGMGRSRSSSSSSSQSGPNSVCTNFLTMYATPRPNPLRGLPSSGSSLPLTSPIVTYATSIADSEISSDDQQFDTYSQYNPSLDEMQMY